MANTYRPFHNVNTRNWQGEAEPHPKRPRQAGPGMLQDVQDLIAKLVAKGCRLVYTDGSSKRLSHKDMTYLRMQIAQNATKYAWTGTSL